MSDSESLQVLNAGNTPVRHPDRKVRVLGIDLGTTTSVAAELEWTPGQLSAPKARCLEIDQSTLDGTYTHTLVPSAIALHDGKEWVGEGAKRLRAKGPQLALERNRDLFYDCKNDIGLRRTYSQAPDRFRNASEIAARVLAFMLRSCEGPTAFDRVVVTVPASFQLAQRQDTRTAARVAGINMQPGDLMDEPVAAFLDYLVSSGDALRAKFTGPRTLLVFDFGGGTCDVAVLRLLPGDGGAGRLSVSPAAVSRYHRLGGGDIDAAVVYEVLIPQLCEQNGLQPASLDFDTKKNFIEPALIGIAEALKIGLCGEIRRLESFGKYDQVARERLVKKQPGVYECHTPLGNLRLQNPTLSALAFDQLLQPFLDQDMLYARETEYRLTLSIFAPIQDALERAGLTTNNIDFCLLVGGSSLIPQVASAVRKFCARAELLKPQALNDLQNMVARGAAYQALSLELFGATPFGAVAYDDISIQTSSGPVVLMKKGASLPYPADRDFAVNRALVAPETVMRGDSRLAVELVAGSASAGRPLLTRVWTIPAVVSKGDPLELKFRVTEDQVFEFELRLTSAPGQAPFRETVENPLNHVANPQAAKIEIDRIEEELRTGQSGTSPDRALVQLGGLHVDIGQREKALDCLRRALAVLGQPDAEILNRMAGIQGELGNFDQEEKLYREAAGLSAWTGPLFNLALAKRRRGKFAEAILVMEDYMPRRRDAPDLVLRGALAGDVSDSEGKKLFLSQGVEMFGDIDGLNDWQLGWLEFGAKLAGRNDVVEAVGKARKSRKGANPSNARDGILPDIAPALSRGSS